jgi:hypothetical protein
MAQTRRMGMQNEWRSYLAITLYMFQGVAATKRFAKSGFRAPPSAARRLEAASGALVRVTTANPIVGDQNFA